MKNIEDYINDARKAMVQQTDMSYFTYSLVVRQQKLICIGSKGGIKGDIHVKTFGVSRFGLGFTSAEWTHIGTKIQTVMKGLGL